MKPTARVIITEACPRKCEYCCNKMPNIRAQMQYIDSMSDIPQGYEELIISGGEPLLFPNRVLQILYEHADEYSRVYLYTAGCNQMSDETTLLMLRYLSGINYTIHDGLSKYDYAHFVQMQSILMEYDKQSPRTLSHRLMLGPNIQRPFPIIPYIWSDIRVKRWRTENEVCVPPTEDLYILKSQ